MGGNGQAGVPVSWKETRWIYLNIDDPFVAWETYRGCLLTGFAGAIPPEWRPISLLLASAIQRDDLVRLQHELFMERVRLAEYPQTVSRVRGMYFFPDRETANRAATEWDGSPAHFKPDRLVEVGFMHPPRTSQHDSNWIDRYMFEDRHFDTPDLDWIRPYWSGMPFIEAKPIWEVLMEGVGWVWGTATRKAAYELLEDRFPESLGILEVGRIAADLDSNLGHCAPFVKPGEAGSWTLRYLMDMRDATDAGFLQSLRTYEGARNQVMLNQMNDAEFFRAPDFTRAMFDFRPPLDLAEIL